MLKMRLITIFVALPIFLLAMWYLPQLWFAIFSALLLGLAAWEWGDLIRLPSVWWRILYAGLVVLSLGLTFVVPIIYWFFLALLVWLWAFVAVFCYARGHEALGFSLASVKGVMGFAMLIPFWLAMNILRNTRVGPLLLIFVFVLVWAVDSGAYVVGRIWGRHLLAPRVSPKKTGEGLAGGLLLAMIFVFAYGYFRGVAPMQTIWLALLSFITALFSVVGDLFESVLKRQVDVKDSGNLLPGHGGILDRFDSAIAALPIFALGMLVLL